MAGQSSGRGISSTFADIKAVCSHSGTMDDEASKIGGEGRMGGAPAAAPHRPLTSRYSASMGGNAKTGETGYNSGSGKSS